MTGPDQPDLAPLDLTQLDLTPPDLGEIVRRLGHLEDLAQIHQLFVDYGHFLDAGDFASYADLFAADGIVKLGPMGSATGREEIRALMERALAGTAGSSYHVISSPGSRSTATPPRPK